MFLLRTWSIRGHGSSAWKKLTPMVKSSCRVSTCGSMSFLSSISDAAIGTSTSTPTESGSHRIPSIYEECWRADPHSITNDLKLDTDAVLTGLCSPAPQSMFVIQRALGRSRNATEVLQHCIYLLKPGRSFAVSIADPTEWSILLDNELVPVGWRRVDNVHFPSTLELAHEAMEVVSSGAVDPDEYLEHIANSAKVSEK